MSTPLAAAAAATPRPKADIHLASDALPGKIPGTPVWMRRDEGECCPAERTPRRPPVSPPTGARLEPLRGLARLLPHLRVRAARCA
jgi:hypothetical protein